jgi:hypothetical protein
VKDFVASMDVPDFIYTGDDDDDTSQHPKTSSWDEDVIPGGNE